MFRSSPYRNPTVLTLFKNILQSLDNFRVFFPEIISFPQIILKIEKLTRRSVGLGFNVSGLSEAAAAQPSDQFPVAVSNSKILTAVTGD